MKQKGHTYVTSDGINHYEELKIKRDLILQGNEYKIINVAPYLIAAVGSLIPNINKNTKNKVIKSKKKIDIIAHIDKFLNEIDVKEIRS